MSRSDGREILLEIQRNVNILFDIEPTRQSEKVFSGEMRAVLFSWFFRRFSLYPSLHPSSFRRRKKGETSRDGNAIINVIIRQN